CPGRMVRRQFRGVRGRQDPPPRRGSDAAPSDDVSEADALSGTERSDAGATRRRSSVKSCRWPADGSAEPSPIDVTGFTPVMASVITFGMPTKVAPTYFSTEADFRSWLKSNHTT